MKQLRMNVGDGEVQQAAEAYRYICTATTHRGLWMIKDIFHSFIGPTTIRFFVRFMIANLNRSFGL